MLLKAAPVVNGYVCVFMRSSILGLLSELIFFLFMARILRIASNFEIVRRRTDCGAVAKMFEFTRRKVGVDYQTARQCCK